MPTRRNFLSHSAAALPLLIPRTGLVEAQPKGESAAVAPSVIPPAIAALKSRKAEAKPITVEEREQRFERARVLMAKDGLDAILMIGGTTLDYFTGVRWWNSERLFAFVLPQKGSGFCVAPAFEEERLREQLTRAPGGKSVAVLTWQEDENPYVLVAKGLKDRGLAAGKVGVEERTTFVFADEIAKANPGLTIASATPVTAGCRAVKSETELALMRLANQVTLAAYEAAWKSVKVGMTNRDVSALIGQAYGMLGFPGEASCQVGEYSALPHGSIQPQTIVEGAVILIDDGCTVEGYQSDISRSFVLGKASDKMKRVFEVVQRAQSAALAAARPGVECQAIDSAARGVVDSAGFGPGYVHFSHRVGHGIGMDGHEWPYLVRGNRTKLERGMTFSDEPGVYLRGEFGIRLEDDWFVTETGGEMFTPQSKSLEEPFG